MLLEHYNVALKFFLRVRVDRVANESTDSRSGLAFAVSAYLLWGILPIYMKLLAHVPPAEVVAHRVAWSVPIAAAVLISLGRVSDLVQALRSPKMLSMGLLTAALISFNWTVYVWAIANDHALDAALGYYINPLFSVALGAIFLKERPNLIQLVAIGFAVIAVVILTVSAGSLPVVTVALFVSWGMYALAKKRLPIGPNQGFLLEVLVLLPFALGYIFYLILTGAGSFLADGPVTTLLLLGCGAVTAVPLLLYSNGAKRLRLTTIAILQYIAPTMIFLCAVFIFKEPFTGPKVIAFPLIWIALVVYTASLISSLGSTKSGSKIR